MRNKIPFQLKPFAFVGALALLACSSAAPAAPAWNDYAARPDDWYRSGEGTRITTNILSWQSSFGSWPKNTNTVAMPYPGDPKDHRGHI